MPDFDRPVFITNIETRTRLTITAASADSPIALAAPEASDRQTWLLRRFNDDFHYIVHVATGLVLDVEAARTAPGTPVILGRVTETTSEDDNRNQLWSVAGDGRIRSRNTAQGVLESDGDRVVFGADAPGRLTQGWILEGVTADLDDSNLYASGQVPVSAGVVLEAMDVGPDDPAPGLTARGPQLGIGDFTAELWFRTRVGGPLLSLYDSAAGNRLLLDVRDRGALQLQISSGPFGSIGLVVDETDALDGRWHHIAAIREDDALRIVFDGQDTGARALEIGGQPQIVVVDLDARVLGIGNAAPNALDGFPPLRRSFVGGIDEVRIWRRALDPRSLRDGRFRTARGFEADLVGQWSLDSNSTDDASGSANHATLGPATRFEAAAAGLVTAGEPYLVVKSRLMEDYRSTDDGFGLIDAFRFTVQAYDGDDRPRAGTLTVEPDRAATFCVDGAQGIQTLDRAAGEPLELTTDVTGAASFSLVRPPGSGLTAPLLQLRADFMDGDEVLLVAADRSLHHELSEFAAASDPTARAVRSMMASAREHTFVEPTDNAPTAGLGTRAVMALVDPDNASGARARENVYISNSAYDPQSGVAASGYRPTPPPQLLRVVDAAAMEVPHWRLDDAGFTPLDPADAAAALAGVTTSGDAASQALLDALASGQQLDAAGIAQLRASVGSRRRGPFSVLSSLVSSASSLVVSTVNVVVDEVDDAAQAVGTAVVDGAEAVGGAVVAGTQQVVKTVVVVAEDAGEVVSMAVVDVEEAAAITEGLLDRIEMDAEDAIEFARSLFEWGDIVLSARVIEAHLRGMFDFTRDELGTLEALVQARLTAIGDDLGAFFDRLRARFAGMDVASQRDTATPSGQMDPQSDFLMSMLRSHLADPATRLDSGSSGDLDQRLTGLDRLMSGAGQQSSATDSLLSLLGDRSTLFDAPIDALLRASEAILQGLLNETGVIVEVAEELARVLLDVIEEVLEASIEIPIVSAFYTSVVRPEATELTLLGLVSTLAALPFTVAWKAAHDGAAPFSEGDAVAHEHRPSTAYRPFFGADDGGLARRASTPGNPPAIAKALGYLFGIGVGIKALLAALGEASGVGTSKRIDATIAVGLQLSSYPGWTLPADDPALLIEEGIWWYQWIGAVFDGLPTLEQRSARVARFQNSTAKTVSTNVYALVHGAAFLALFDFEVHKADLATTALDFVKLVGNLASVVAEVDFGEALSEATSRVSNPALVVWGLTTTLRLTIDFASSARFRPF